MAPPTTTRAIPADAALAAGERRARSARLAAVRGTAMFLVVLVHSTVVPGLPAFAAAPPAWRSASAIAYHLAVNVAVPAFLMLAFMPLHPALAGARGWGRRLRQRCLHVVPVFLFWAALYAGLKFAAGEARPTPSRLAEYLVLGTSAAHLYFLPLLVVLTALAPLWVAIARRPALAVGAGLALALGASYAAGLLPPGAVWPQAALGMVGNSVYPLAAMALVQRWRGWEPRGGDRSTLALSGAAAAIAAAILVGHAVAEASAAGPLPWSFAERAARVVFPVGLVTAVLASRTSAPSWAELLGPLSFGVYLLHPLVVKPLRTIELHVPALAARAVALALPNAVLAFAASLAIVYALMNTRARAVLT